MKTMSLSQVYPLGTLAKSFLVSLPAVEVQRVLEFFMVFRGGITALD